MAFTSFSTAEKATLQLAIDLLVKTSAEELPPDARISEVVSRVAASSGFSVSDGAFLQNMRDNPHSTLLRFILYAGQ